MYAAIKKVVIGVIVVWICLTGIVAGAQTGCKVLVVMSYDETYAWEKEIREGIESVLSSRCELKYAYLDTNRDVASGLQKAKEAYELYLQFQPDGVITADDNAQTMFVVPYLKDKVKTPVIFCGVNAEAKDYGFPATNVSGILERLHIMESVLFAQQLMPEVKTFAMMQKDTSSAEAIARQIALEKETYPVKFMGYYRPKTLNEAFKQVEELKLQADLLFYETFDKIPDENGQPLTDKQVVPLIAKAFGKPLIGNNAYHVQEGVLCAVIKMGQEQGRVAAEMLMQAIGGKLVSELEIAVNKQGKRLLNVTVLREFNLKPKPYVLQNVELVETVK